MHTKKGNDEQGLKKVYIDIVGRVCPDPVQVADCWTAVVRAYADKRRHYHTLVHLGHFYEQLLSCRDKLVDFETAFLAMVYHDVVYFSPAGRDEEESAAYAERDLTRLGFAAGIIERCTALIMATKTHAETADRDVNYFVDADMAILGEDAATYDRYAANIRQEYGDTPLFDAGRARVLVYFLGMPRIYKTEWFYDRYEVPARANIQRELEVLRSKAN